MKKNFDPFSDLPPPCDSWVKLPKSLKIKKINDMISASNDYNILEAINVFNDTEVIIKINKYLSASERGSFLLDFEDFLKKEIDKSLYIMIEPMGDKNSLRKFRGIEIKKGYEK